MIRAVIADDEPLVRERLRTLLAAHGDTELVGEGVDGADTLQLLLRTCPDLVLLDIQMPALSGFEVLEAVPPARRPAVVFITAFDEYAVRGFEVNAVDYLLKPVERRRFDEALERVRARRRGEPAGPAPAVDQLLADLRRARGYATRLVARRGSAVVFVPVVDLDWIEARGNYARLHAAGTTHLVRASITDLASRLDPDHFVRIHRSAIVHLDHVATVEPHVHGEYVLTLRDGTRLTSSRTHSAALRALLR